MHCTMCGAVIPDGQTTCPTCGNAVTTGVPTQPMNQQTGYQQQPMMNQQMGYQQQPMNQQGPAISVNVSGIKSMMNGDFVRLLGFIGAFLITLAPFLSWMNSKEFIKMSFNLFGYGKTADKGGITACAIFIVIFGLILITLELADYINSLSGIKSITSSIPYFEVIVAAIALILLFVCFFSKDLRDAAKGDDTNRGIGFLFGLIGCLASAAANMVRRAG
ncbi:MAG: hypothetical protein K2G45_09325 [Lachnospiraceae bacterium]|nr:hypothetical protein [Lachnospiraceae bacterium]